MIKHDPALEPRAAAIAASMTSDTMAIMLARAEVVMDQLLDAVQQLLRENDELRQHLNPPATCGACGCVHDWRRRETCAEALKHAQQEVAR